MKTKFGAFAAQYDAGRKPWDKTVIARCNQLIPTSVSRLKVLDLGSGTGLGARALAGFGRVSSWGPVAMAAERSRVGDAVRRLQIDTRAGSE